METFPAVSPLRLGLIGLNWGDRVARAAASLPGVAIRGCFARTKAAREEFAARHGCEPYPTYEAMLNDPGIDGIIVMTPNATHRELTLAALAAGKPVLVTKPIAATMVDALAMIATARQQGRLLVVGHQARRHAGVRAMKTLLERGVLGTPVMIESNMSSPTGLTRARSWRESAAECPGGPLLQLGIHAIDNFQYLLGDLLDLSSYHRRMSAGNGPPEITHTLCRFASGATGSLASSYVSPWTRWLRLTGTEAAACYDGANGMVVSWAGKAPETVVPPTPNEEIVAQAMADELAEFASCILNKGMPEIDGEVGARNLAVVLAAVESNRRGAAVSVAELWPGAEGLRL